MLLFLIFIFLLFLKIYYYPPQSPPEPYYLGEYWKVQQCKCPRNIDIV